MIRTQFGSKRPRKCCICKTNEVANKFARLCPQEECVITYANQEREKRLKKEMAKIVKADREDTKIRREKLKSRSDWLKETQIAFNAFIRYRDMLAGYLCISSNKPLDWNGNAVDAGHYRSTGSAPHLRFNENNCHAQSKHDNRYLSGNAVDYRIGLIARIGLESVEEIEADNEPRKYTISDLISIKKVYKNKLKELQKAEQ